MSESLPTHHKGASAGQGASGASAGQGASAGLQTALLQRLMYRKSEAAQLLGISVRTVENLIAAKELKARKIGKCVLISHQVLLDFTRHDHKTAVPIAQVN